MYAQQLRERGYDAVRVGNGEIVVLAPEKFSFNQSKGVQNATHNEKNKCAITNFVFAVSIFKSNSFSNYLHAAGTYFGCIVPNVAPGMPCIIADC